MCSSSDAECDHAQEHKHEEMKTAERIIVRIGPLRQDVCHVQCIGSNERPAEKLARQVGQAQAAEQLPAQVRGKNQQAQPDHLDRHLRRVAPAVPARCRRGACDQLDQVD